MKNKIKIIYPLLLVLAVQFGCETEHIMYDSSKNHVAFIQSQVNIAEEGGQVAIPVMVAAMVGDPALTVSFEIDAEQSVAVNGTDFNINTDPMTLNFPNGWGYDTIWLTPIDNDEFGGNISFVIRLNSNSQNYQFGAQDSIICTIVDNEHPLGQWIGTYNVEARSYGSPGAWDEAWTVTTSPDPDDVSKLIFQGVAGWGDGSFAASFDLENMTVTIPAGTAIGTAYGYKISIWVGDEDLNLDKTKPIVGEISEDGSMHIDYVGEEISEGTYAGYIWDVFDTYWTKASKNSKPQQKPVPVKITR